MEAKARKQIASLLGVLENEIIFTSGATEANNLAIKGVALFYKDRGKHIITSKVEHPSILDTFDQLEKEFGFDVTYLDVDSFGRVNIEQLKSLIRNDTILVSIMSVNNEVGSINDIEEFAKLIKQYPKIYFHSDITQAVGKININLKDIDLASLSLHKIHGFKGSGILIKKSNVNLLPLLSGGGQEYGLRSGTNNLPVEVSAAKTLRIAIENLSENYDKVSKIRDYLFEELNKIEGVKLNSTLEGSPYIVNFSIPKKASVIVEDLSKKQIYVSTKSACSSKKSSLSYVLSSMGRSDFESSNAIRVSFSNNSNIEEVKVFIEELKKSINSIR